MVHIYVMDESEIFVGVKTWTLRGYRLTFENIMEVIPF